MLIVIYVGEFKDILNGCLILNFLKNKLIVYNEVLCLICVFLIKIKWFYSINRYVFLFIGVKC